MLRRNVHYKQRVAAPSRHVTHQTHTRKQHREQLLCNSDRRVAWRGMSARRLTYFICGAHGNAFLFIFIYFFAFFHSMMHMLHDFIEIIIHLVSTVVGANSSRRVLLLVMCAIPQCWRRRQKAKATARTSQPVSQPGGKVYILPASRRARMLRCL